MAKKPTIKAAKPVSKVKSAPAIRIVTSKGKPSRVTSSLPARFPEHLQPGQVLVDMSKPKPVYYMVADIGLGWNGTGWDLSNSTLAILNDSEVGRIAATRRRILKANGWL